MRTKFIAGMLGGFLLLVAVLVVAVDAPDTRTAITKNVFSESWHGVTPMSMEINPKQPYVLKHITVSVGSAFDRCQGAYMTCPVTLAGAGGSGSGYVCVDFDGQAVTGCYLFLEHTVENPTSAYVTGTNDSQIDLENPKSPIVYTIPETFVPLLYQDSVIHIVSAAYPDGAVSGTLVGCQQTEGEVVCPEQLTCEGEESLYCTFTGTEGETDNMYGAICMAGGQEGPPTSLTFQLVHDVTGATESHVLIEWEGDNEETIIIGAGESPVSYTMGEGEMSYFSHDNMEISVITSGPGHTSMAAELCHEEGEHDPPAILGSCCHGTNCTDRVTEENCIGSAGTWSQAPCDMRPCDCEGELPEGEGTADIDVYLDSYLGQQFSGTLVRLSNIPALTTLLGGAMNALNDGWDYVQIPEWYMKGDRLGVECLDGNTLPLSVNFVWEQPVR